MTLPSVPTGERLRAVEHHHFQLGERWYLFDVLAMTVHPSSALDGPLLDLAGDGESPARLVDRLAASGHPAAEVAERIERLAAERFLLPPGEEVRAATSGRATRYVTFMVNVAQRCNLTCPYCYVREGLFDYAEKPIPRMKDVTAESVVDRLHDSFPGFETYGYHFYGGEPLLNFKAIRTVVERAEAKAAATGTATDYHITTNGTLLRREVADFFDAHRFTVYFSIDGDRENHDQLRRYRNGRGSFDDVEANLEYLRTRPGVHLIGSSVIRKGFTLHDAMEHLESHGASQCKAERVRLHDGDDLALEGGEHDDYLADITGLVDHYVERLSAGEKPMDFRLSSKILQLVTRTRRDFFCPAGERMFGVSADGEIYPCALHVGRPQSKLGDLDTGLDPKLRDAFRRRFGTAEQPVCSTCWNRTLCGGGCSAMVDRFGHEDCASLMAESRAAIAVYQHFTETDPVRLFGLVSPRLVRWAAGELDDPDEIAPTEPAAERVPGAVL